LVDGRKRGRHKPWRNEIHGSVDLELKTSSVPAEQHVMSMVVPGKDGHLAVKSDKR
jgi:hypothetical protein